MTTRAGARTGLLAVSAGAVLWGTTGVAVRIISDRTGLSAVSIGCYRLAFAAAALALVLRRSAFARTRDAWRTHRWALIAAGAGLGGYQALYFVGVQDVGVSVSTLVSLAVAPVALTTAAAIAARRRPGPAASMTVLCAVGGLALVSVGAGHHAHAPHPLVGVLASLASGLGYAATTVINRRMAANGDAMLLTAATSAVGAVVLLPIALPAGMGTPADGIAIGWLIYIGVVPTALAYWLFYAGLRSTRTEVAGVLTLLEPLTAALLAAVALGERLSALGWIGGGLLLAAITALYVRPDPDVGAGEPL